MAEVGYAYVRKDNGQIGYVTEDSQGFQEFLKNPNLIVTQINEKPVLGRDFDPVTKTMKNKGA